MWSWYTSVIKENRLGKVSLILLSMYQIFSLFYELVSFWSSVVLTWDHVLLVSGLWGLAQSKLWGAAVMLSPQTLVRIHKTLNSEMEQLSWGQIKILQYFVPLFEVFDLLCFLEGFWRSIFQMWSHIDYDLSFIVKIQRQNKTLNNKDTDFPLFTS